MTGAAADAPSRAPIPPQRPAAIAAPPTDAITAPRPIPRPDVRPASKPAATSPGANPQRATRAQSVATRTAPIPEGAMLIGILGAPAGRTALLRGTDGRVQRLRPGSRIDGWTIADITETEVRLSRDGQSRTLRLP